MDALRSTSISTLVASWAELVRPSGGSVGSGPSFFAARCPHPVFNNALLLAPDVDAIAAVSAFYRQPDVRWSLWTGDSDTGEAASSRGFVADGGTTDMARPLVDLPTPPGASAVVRSSPEIVAAVNGLAPELLRGAVGFSAYSAGSDAAGILSFRHEGDVQLSFLATKPAHRHRGLATALVTAALHDAQRQGAKTASLQATAAAVSLYERLGFRAVGEWREWVLPSPA